MLRLQGQDYREGWDEDAKAFSGGETAYPKPHKGHGLADIR